MSGAERTKSAEKNLQARNAMRCDAMRCVLALCHEFGALCNRMDFRTFGFKAKLRVWFARVSEFGLGFALCCCDVPLYAAWRMALFVSVHLQHGMPRATWLGFGLGFGHHSVLWIAMGRPRSTSARRATARCAAAAVLLNPNAAGRMILPVL